MTICSYAEWKRGLNAEPQPKQADLAEFLKPDPVKQLRRLTAKKQAARLADRTLDELRDRAVIALGRAAGLNRRQRAELAERVQRDVDRLQAAQVAARSSTGKVLRSSGWLGSDAEKPSAGRSSALRTLRSVKDSVVTPIPHGARGAASWEEFVRRDASGQETILGARLVRSMRRQV